MELTLVVPGLLRFEDKSYRELVVQAERIPALELIISRSQRLKTNGYNLESSLGELFGLSEELTSSLPVAALSHYLKFGELNDNWYMPCDPVVMQPNRDHLLMLMISNSPLTGLASFNAGCAASSNFQSSAYCSS